MISSAPEKSGDPKTLAKRNEPRPETGSFFAQIAATDPGHAAAAPGKRSMNGLIVLAIVVIIAGAGLVTMRRIGLGTKLELTDLKIDYPIDGAINLDHQKVLEELSAKQLANQVPVERVQKNPFLWDESMTKPTVAKETTKGPTGPDPAAEAARLAAENRRKIDTKFNTLTLNSVMDGRVPVAVISGKMVRVGETIEGLFVVGAIRPKERSVELLADGRTYTLTMEEPK